MTNEMYWKKFFAVCGFFLTLMWFFGVDPMSFCFGMLRHIYWSSPVTIIYRKDFLCFIFSRFMHFKSRWFLFLPQRTWHPCFLNLSHCVKIIRNYFYDTFNCLASFFHLVGFSWNSIWNGWLGTIYLAFSGVPQRRWSQNQNRRL